MAEELERGDACVVVGIAHCPGVLAELDRRGFSALPLRV
jgi:hypothetical protein